MSNLYITCFSCGNSFPNDLEEFIIQGQLEGIFENLLCKDCITIIRRINVNPLIHITPIPSSIDEKMKKYG